MFDSLKGLFNRKATSVIGVDIGTSAIKVVQLRRKGSKAILETYGALALGPYAGVGVGKATNLPTEKVIEALSDVMKEAKITTKQSGVAIPFGSSLMSIIEMPALGEKQLNLMVPLEARKYIPVPISEVNLDWSIIPKGEIKSEPARDNYFKEKTPKIDKTEVLIVAIHKDTISDYEDIVSKAGLDAKFFEIEIFSTIRSVLDRNPQPVMILDIGAASTKLYIVERGGVRVSHTINRGSQDITSAIAASVGVAPEQAELMKRQTGYSKSDNISGQNISELISVTLDFVFAEAHRVMLAFQQKYAKDISQVMLVGGGAAMSGIVEIAKNTLQTEVVKADPFSKVEAPAVLTEVLRNNGPEFAVAVGVALRCLQEGE